MLSELPAGVFDELTALKSLLLHENRLSELPAGVFDELTALESLLLHENRLSELPDGVFDELTALKSLLLHDNRLSELPAGVFAELTALETLLLGRNRRVPFAPTAVGLPDDETVSGGGTVTLDGSGSDGGAWGTNVSYSWALTDPASGVTVSFDNEASATTAVTISELAADTELTFTLTVTGRGNGSGIAPGTDTVTVNVTAGICGRTPAVRDAILGRIPGVSNCADVTDTHLADITGTLNLRNRDITITALAAGDFAGLIALTRLNLINNDLTTLPADVFAGLTSLTTLILDNNDLTTLPAGVFAGSTSLTTLYMGSNDLTTLSAGVFAGLTELETLYLNNNRLTTLSAGVFAGLGALTKLRLNSNDLTTLPDDVFEPLTALTGLWLGDNTGADFAPVAVALPDDGTVPVAGGMVTLDGSGSGGAWGTNVSYSWALTDPASGVDVSFDDNTSVTPQAAISALAADTELTFTLTVTGRGGPSGSGIASATDTATVTVNVTTGICGRTPEVRDALVNRIHAISYCADVTDVDLAAITGTLDLGYQDITALKAGDFAGLASLTILQLDVNKLATLPAGVFDDLTALEILRLDDNALDMLPDDVFEPLTSLRVLRLEGNPEAPFAPEAVALPDDGTVSSGGTVTLDGSGSGGAWGTNVSYSWALTDPASGVDVLFDDNTSVTPQVAISALAADTELTFTLTVTGRGGTHGIASATATATATVTVNLAGICGRTPEVRDALVNRIHAISYCADVTDVDLAAITGTLNLSSQSITALAAGDFDGLTALESLWLRDNALSELPDGVFAELTALETLYLAGNTGVPFAPTAVALPDDGRVVNGGTVTLDGSGSGGAWGTNVSYSWALTDPASGVDVSFDDNTSVTPQVAISALAADTELTFTLTVTGRGGPSGSGIASATDTATVTVNVTTGICGRTPEVRDALVSIGSTVSPTAPMSPMSISPPSPARWIWATKTSPPSRRGISPGWPRCRFCSWTSTSWPRCPPGCSMT